NETTRHAHVILPGTSPLQRSHYDLALNAFAVRNVARYSPAVFPRGEEDRHDWEICVELMGRMTRGNAVRRAAGRVAARARATVASRVGSIDVPVEVSDEMMPGVVSLPHGWGHDRPGTRLGVASAHAGASANDITDETFIDALSGNSALSGVTVEVRAAVG